MSADLSRIRFDPRRDHSGVGIQQGRLWLDADFNEQVAISDRRMRAQVVDLSPAQTVVSRLTPDAFAITASGGALSIGAGRMYVDGLLAENHGATPVFDPVLAEPNGTGVVDYLEQPYWPTPDPLPTGGTHLVYLDVWDRELDYLTTPDLVDSAIGVDTTTRTQTVWQVRLLTDIGDGVACDSDIAAWDTLVAPSSARLSTGTVEVDPVDDPCEIPPGKGYRGPENQLYRVELISPTQFVWSRDNATVASAVAHVNSATSLRLESLGRDDVLRIKDNDWVEITDDRRELDRLSGDLRQVTVDVAASVITFTPALTDLATGGVNLRVRKWDSAAITVPTDGSPVTLEYGVTVTFSSTGSGTPHAGDYWVFAARATAPTPDQSLEILDAAPPRGIHHHYARLALVTLPGTVDSDCRPGWPVAGGGDECGCEICVTPEGHNSGKATIQAAIDALKKSNGGTVKLCPGVYKLDRPLMIGGARSITLRGSGESSRLEASGTAIAVAMGIDVTLDHFAVYNLGDAPAILIFAATRDCRLASLTVRQKEGVGIGLSGVHQRLSIRDCQIQAGTGIGVVVPPEGVTAVYKAADAPMNLMTVGLTVTGNLLDCFLVGIGLVGVCQHLGPTLIGGNTLRNCATVGITMNGLVPHDAGGAVGGLEISHNLFDVTGSGIRIGGRARILANTINAQTRSDGQCGVMLEAQPPDTPDGVAEVLANEITGCGSYGIVVTAPMRTLVIAQNLVRGAVGGILVVAAAAGNGVTIDDNQILDLVSFGGTYTPPPAVGALSRKAAAVAAPVAEETTVMLPAAGARVSASQTDTGPQVDTLSTYAGLGYLGAVIQSLVAIVVYGAATASIRGNTIDGVGATDQDAGQKRAAGGIVVVACVEAQISGNTISRIGQPVGAAGDSAGIAVATWQDMVIVTDNVVLSGSGPEPVTRDGWTALSLVTGSAYATGGVQSVYTAKSAWTFVGDRAYQQERAAAHAVVSGNNLQGGANTVGVLVSTGGDVMMSANRCVQPAGSKQQAVRLTAGVAVVQGNRLVGGDPSMTMTVPANAVAVVGNITSGGIQYDTVSGPDPWATLNPNA
jgi:hypothetical protein